MRLLGDWADFMYDPDVRISHVVPFGQQYSLCGGRPLALSGWWGTGDWEEIETARSLPRCEKCLDAIPDDRRPR